MKLANVTSLSAAIALSMMGSAAFAQSSSPAEIQLSPAAQRILCERSPYNSRCAANAAGAPGQTVAPNSASPASTNAPKVPQNGPGSAGIGEPSPVTGAREPSGDPSRPATSPTMRTPTDGPGSAGIGQPPADGVQREPASGTQPRPTLPQ